MSATGYPRTDGASGASPSRLRSALHKLRLAGNQVHVDARNAVEQLEALAKIGTPSADMVIYARETTEAILVAKFASGARLDQWQTRSMALCAEHWRREHPFGSSGYQPTARQYVQDYQQCTTDKDRKIVQEKVGSLAALYEIGALIGEDLSATVLAGAVQLGTSGFREYRAPQGRLHMLECAAAYSVNLVLTCRVPGLAQPLVIVAEAKGGNSRYSEVKGPADMPAKTLLMAPTTPIQVPFFPITQTELRYAVSRAYYMIQDQRTGPEFQARKQMGREILAAAGDERLVYLTARGKISQNGFITRRENLECN